MKFRTAINIEKHRCNLSHSDKVLALGSCFVENIGVKLTHLKFNLNVNPFGIIFNPYSIAKILNNGLEKPIKLDRENDVLAQNGIYKSYDFHSSFNAESYNDFIENTETEFKQLKSQLLKDDYLFLTFGTAWVYRLVDNNRVVANCHKVPQNNFTKSLLDLTEITDIYVAILKRIIEKNSSIKIVLTVSPVRHLKDGVVENNQSKSILLLLCKALADDFKQNVIYFPSYEIQMDDLRDYRFYKSDLIHPNDMAIDYIFEQFSKSFFTTKTVALNKRIDKLNKLESHRFLNATESDKKKHFEKIESLKQELKLV